MQFLESVMSSGLDRELVNKTTNILSILSKKDALSIFLLAKDGLRAETNTPQKVGLTRKQYYTRLKQLVDSGLIDKSGDEYTHTTLGSFVHQKHVLELFEHAKNVKQMKMVDTLKRTRQFSEDDIANFVGKIAGKSLATSNVPMVRVMANYEDMVSVMIERIQFTKKEVLLATRYINELIVNNILMKVKAGLDVRVVADATLFKEYVTDGGAQLKAVDKNQDERLKVTTNPYYPSQDINRRVADVPFSVMIFDRKEVALELVDSHNIGRFKCALLMNDETLVGEFVKYFESLWEQPQGSAVDAVKNEIRTT